MIALHWGEVIPQSHLRGSPHALTVVPSYIVANMSTAAWPTAFTVNSTVTFAVTARDWDGNVVNCSERPAEIVNFVATLDWATGFNTTCSGANFVVSFVPHLLSLDAYDIEEQLVAVLYSGVPIAGSPRLALASAGLRVFPHSPPQLCLFCCAADIFAPTCTADWPEITYAGTPSTFLVTLRDIESNLVSCDLRAGELWNWSARHVVDERAIMLIACRNLYLDEATLVHWECEGAEMLMSFVPHRAGVHSLEVMRNNVSISASPNALTVLPGLPISF